MKDILIEAQEELKRLEHIIYVSLKYTRTVDVLINGLKRLVNIYDLIIEALSEKAVVDGLLPSLQKSPALRSTQLAKLYPDDNELQKYLSFYLFLKTVLKMPHTKRREYRRHVTLIVELENMTAEIDSDSLINCERFTHKFLNYAIENALGKVKDEYNCFSKD